MRPPRVPRPRLEHDTPLVALAVARQVVEEASLYLGQPLPARHAARLAHRARAIYAHSPAWRGRLCGSGDAGRDCLYVFMRHWLAALLHAEHPALYARLPAGFALGKRCPPVPLPHAQSLPRPEPAPAGPVYLRNEARQLIA